MAHPELRINVERLLEGHRDPEDLHRLFGYLRFHTKGRAPAVKDVGDFQAHWDQRDQGLSYERALRFYDMWRVGPFARASGLVPTLNDHEMALGAALELVRDTIQEYSGFAYQKAKVLLASVLRKSTVDEKGDLRFRERLDPRETTLFRALTTCPKHDELLTQDELFDQFAGCLVAEGLLRNEELRPFSVLTNWVAVYAISKMHLVDLLRPRTKEKVGVLEARTSPKTDTLAVYVNVNRTGGQMIETRELFSTHCVPEEWCAPELLDVHAGPIVSMANWTLPIRLNSNGKLVPIGRVDPAQARVAYVRENFRGVGRDQQP